MDKAAQTLAAWEALREQMAERVSSGRARYGVFPPEEIKDKSGLEVFAAVLADQLPHAPIGETLDFFMVEAERGRVVFQGRPRAQHYNPLGSVHGGWFATLLDSAVGCAVQSCVPVGKSYTTVELKVNIVRALTDKVPVVRAEGKVVHMGGQIATAEGRLFGHDGKLYAHASTTCLVFDYPPAKR